MPPTRARTFENYRNMETEDSLIHTQKKRRVYLSHFTAHQKLTLYVSDTAVIKGPANY